MYFGTERTFYGFRFLSYCGYLNLKLYRDRLEIIFLHISVISKHDTAKELNYSETFVGLPPERIDYNDKHFTFY